jgi:cephalosporin-C deacetylase-like acetyl esterase
VNRIAGWPKFVALDSAGKPEPASLETSRYIDAVNFASRSKASGCALTVGFIDTTCPPTSVYAAFNNINVPKTIYDDIPSGHSQSREASAFMQAAVMKHVGK